MRWPPGSLVRPRAGHAGLRPQRCHGGHEEGRVVRLLLLAIEGVAGGVAGVLQRLHPRHTPAIRQQAACTKRSLCRAVVRALTQGEKMDGWMNG